MPQQRQQYGQLVEVSPAVTLNAATAVGVGTTVDLGVAVNNITMALSGTATSAQVNLEGSLDNAAFFPLVVDTAATVVTPRAVTSTGKPVRYVRGNVISISASTNVTAKIMASN